VPTAQKAAQSSSSLFSSNNGNKIIKVNLNHDAQSTTKSQVSIVSLALEAFKT